VVIAGAATDQFEQQQFQEQLEQRLGGEQQQFFVAVLSAASANAALRRAQFDGGSIWYSGGEWLQLPLSSNLSTTLLSCANGATGAVCGRNAGVD